MGRRPIDPRRAIPRLALSGVSGLAAYAIVSAHVALLTALLVGADVAIFVLLAASWVLFGRADADLTQSRAGAEDPGRTVVYVLVLLGSAASLLASTALVGSVHRLAPGLENLDAALCLTTVALAWSMTHTAFTFRYAHLYYREDAEGVGGIDFAGGLPPTYLDFAYFAFTVGMCFQVSDTCVTSPQIRITVLLHAVMSFAYNSVILAFVLNLMFGLANSG